MKKLLSILGALVIAFTASAQFIVTAPSGSSALVSNTVFIVPGETTTNVPTTVASQFKIGRDGFGLTINHSGTNATTTTNTTFIFEFSGDGVNYGTNNRLTVLSIPLGVTYAPHYTNIANTVPSVGNAMYGRLRSIQNTNLASIFITNLGISTR